MKKYLRISSGFIGSRRGFLIEVERAEQRNWKHHEKRAIIEGRSNREDYTVHLLSQTDSFHQNAV